MELFEIFSFTSSLLAILILDCCAAAAANSVQQSYFERVQNSSLVNTASAQNLIEQISTQKKTRDCFRRCTVNSQCNSIEISEAAKTCKLYTQSAEICSVPSNSSTVYVKRSTINALAINSCGLTTTSTSTQAPMCQSGWSQLDSYCYKHFQQGPFSWSNALAYCQNLNASLLYLGSQERLEFFGNISQSQNSYFWVGGHAIEGYNFFWLRDNSPVNASFWGTGEPNNAGAAGLSIGEGCMSLVAHSPGLNDDTCTAGYSDIYCEYPLYRPQTIVMYNLSCRPGWKRFQSICYFYNPILTLSWNDAVNFCLQQNATLLFTKHRTVFNYFSQISDNFWVGANGSVLNGFFWLDGTQVNGVWGSGEPNNAGGNPNPFYESCVFSPWFYLHDDQCHFTKKFICQYTT